MTDLLTADDTLHAIQQWGKDRNIIGDGQPLQQLPKLIEEMGELAGGIARNHQHQIKDGIGDVIVVLSMIAGQRGLTIAECIAHAYDEIKDRKGVLLNGTFIKSTDERYEAAVKELAARTARRAEIDALCSDGLSNEPPPGPGLEATCETLIPMTQAEHVRYHGAGDLDAGIPQSDDPGKRNFVPR
jgi:NTP pyrophosphatase (non-canonical NTP hydrolase)